MDRKPGQLRPVYQLRPAYQRSRLNFTSSMT